MTSHQTPTEIFQSLEKTIQGYIAALDGYTDEQFAHKTAKDVWSLGQMYEHLYVTANFFFLANTVRCLQQRKGQEGGEKNQYGDNIFKYNSFPPIKVKVPEGLGVPELIAKTRDEYKSLLKKVIEDAQKLIDAVTSDAGNYKCIHPVFGWLNAHEWYHNMDMHFRHHLRQQKELETVLS
jgi:hypothetical protein